MRSPRDLVLGGVMAAALAMAAGIPSAAQAQEVRGATAAADPGDAEIARALEQVRADPNLATERTVKTLQWGRPAQPKASARPVWLAWIAGLFGWLEESARVLVWCAAAVLLGMLTLFVVRLWGRHAETIGGDAFVAPTHVRDLDIRPESLPDDIGAAARALWDRGEPRAALALLYRGLLSRLVHVHRLGIRDSSTEGDCLALAAAHLPEKRHAYAASLVGVWQRAVYGREAVSAATVYRLCDGFASALAPAVPRESLSERAS